MKNKVFHQKTSLNKIILLANPPEADETAPSFYI
jgi:hypothetical protein